MLGENYSTFLEDFVCKPLEQLIEQDKISLHDLRRLGKAVYRAGAEAFDLPAKQFACHSRSTVGDGELLRVQLPISKETTIDTFVKIYPTKQEFEDALATQKVAADILLNRAKSNSLVLVPPLFANPKAKLIAYPFVNGETGYEVFEGLNEEDKEKRLKHAMNIHLTMSVVLTKHKDLLMETAPVKKMWSPEETFKRLFFDRLEIDMKDSTALQFQKVITKYLQPIHEEAEEVIHPDFHPGNIIYHGRKASLIDNDQLMIGYTEYALAKFLTKAQIPIASEERLVEYAHILKHAMISNRRPETEPLTRHGPADATLTRYRQTRWSQELLTAARYWKRAQELGKEHLKDMATSAYNLSLRQIQALTSTGNCPDIYQAVLEIMEKVDPEVFHINSSESFIQENSPHNRGSISNVVTVPSIEAIVEENTEAKYKELKRIRNRLRKPRRKRRFATAFVGLAFLTAFGSAGAMFYDSKQKETEFVTKIANLEEKSEWDVLVERTLGAYRNGRVRNSKLTPEQQQIFDKAKYIQEKWGFEEGTAYLWVIDSKVTYEAIQATTFTVLGVKTHTEPWVGSNRKVTAGRLQQYWETKGNYKWASVAGDFAYGNSYGGFWVHYDPDYYIPKWEEERSKVIKEFAEENALQQGSMPMYVPPDVYKKKQDEKGVDKNKNLNISKSETAMSDPE